ncbi:hypothetical protein AVEN_113034-1 [Araneus ventricosus]|uniref:Uncharacterized protein n=1 Tax=Araneus ventricosus TaxID=182803 RepID=A0A4Y2I7Q7_ARAVE|nr:hypothetical protein AVEN_113034-1 [Araneus ventricosus]
MPHDIVALLYSILCDSLCSVGILKTYSPVEGALLPRGSGIVFFLISRVANSKAEGTFRKAPASEARIPTKVQKEVYKIDVADREGSRRIFLMLLAAKGPNAYSQLCFVKPAAKGRIICSNRDAADREGLQQLFSTCCPIRYFSVCPERYVNKQLLSHLWYSIFEKNQQHLKNGNDHHSLFLRKRWVLGGNKFSQNL